MSRGCKKTLTIWVTIGSAILAVAIVAFSAGNAPSKVEAAQVEPEKAPFASLRPYLTGLSVANAQSAALWYEDKLGFKQTGESKEPNGTHLIVVERGAVAIELLEIKNSYSIAKYVPAYRPTSFQLQGIVKVGFAVDDLDSALKELKARDVPIVLGITELKQFQLRFLLIQDSNGNVIQLFDHKDSKK